VKKSIFLLETISSSLGLLRTIANSIGNTNAIFTCIPKKSKGSDQLDPIPQGNYHPRTPLGNNDPPTNAVNFSSGSKPHPQNQVDLTPLVSLCGKFVPSPPIKGFGELRLVHYWIFCFTY